MRRRLKTIRGIKAALADVHAKAASLHLARTTMAIAKAMGQLADEAERLDARLREMMAAQHIARLTQMPGQSWRAPRRRKPPQQISHDNGGPRHGAGATQGG